MQSALKLTTRVKRNGRIEVTAPELKAGQTVDVIVVLPEAASTRSVLDIVESLPAGPRLYRSPEEADRYLQRERESWDR